MCSMSRSYCPQRCKQPNGNIAMCTNISLRASPKMLGNQGVNLFLGGEMESENLTALSSWCIISVSALGLPNSLLHWPS